MSKSDNIISFYLIFFFFTRYSWISLHFFTISNIIINWLRICIWIHIWIISVHIRLLRLHKCVLLRLHKCVSLSGTRFFCDTIHMIFISISTIIFSLIWIFIIFIYIYTRCEFIEFIFIIILIFFTKISHFLYDSYIFKLFSSNNFNFIFWIYLLILIKTI